MLIISFPLRAPTLSTGKMTIFIMMLMMNIVQEVLWKLFKLLHRTQKKSVKVKAKAKTKRNAKAKENAKTKMKAKVKEKEKAKAKTKTKMNFE